MQEDSRGLDNLHMAYILHIFLVKGTLSSMAAGTFAMSVEVRGALRPKGHI